jgi:hypothetical protein
MPIRRRPIAGTPALEPRGVVTVPSALRWLPTLSPSRWWGRSRRRRTDPPPATRPPSCRDRSSANGANAARPVHRRDARARTAYPSPERSTRPSPTTYRPPVRPVLPPGFLCYSMCVDTPLD